MAYKKKTKPKLTTLQSIKYRIKALKRLGVFPVKWEPETFAYFLARINAMLLMADHSFISELFGRTKNKDILPILTAKKIMESDEYKKIRKELLKDNFSDIIKDNGDMAMMLVQRKILEGDNEMAKVALEMDGRWTRGLKVTRVDETKKNKMIKKMVKDLFTPDDVKGLDGDN